MAKKLGIGCGVLVLLFIVLGVVGSMGAPKTGTGSLPGVIAPPAGGAEKIALLSFSCRSEHGFDTCTGEVKNISNDSIKNVTAVTTWRDAAGAAQRTDEAIIEFNPILAGQSSPFKTIGTSNPALKDAGVRFKELLGGEIRVRDERPK